MAITKEEYLAALQTALSDTFKSDSTKSKLRIKMDGSIRNGKKTNSVNFKSSLEIITKEISNTKAELYTQTINELIPNEFSNTITESVCNWLAEDISGPIAQSIVDQTDKYITDVIKTQVDIYIATLGLTGKAN